MWAAQERAPPVTHPSDGGDTDCFWSPLLHSATLNTTAIDAAVTTADRSAAVTTAVVAAESARI